MQMIVEAQKATIFQKFWPLVANSITGRPAKEQLLVSEPV